MREHIELTYRAKIPLPLRTLFSFYSFLLQTFLVRQLACLCEIVECTWLNFC